MEEPEKKNEVKIILILYIDPKGVQWLSGRMLD